MTTCPRCGRDADDEFVCADCGAFLAGGEGEPAAAVSVRRVALLVLIVCLLGAGGAVLLLGGGGGHRPDALLPLVSSPVELSSVPLGTPGESGPARTSGSVIGHPSSSASPSASSSGSSTGTASRSRTATTSSQPATSGAPSRTSPAGSTAPATTPHPSTSHPSTTKPASSPPPQPAVSLAKGTTSCGPHCYSLVVTVSGFGAGSHDVTCFAGHAGQFGQYTTSAGTSSSCSYSHPHDTVWVVVDGTRSNTVNW
jgi:hypothetical protein